MSAADPGKDGITVHIPAELPVLTMSVSRILLAILVELTEVEILGGPPEGTRNDC